MTTKSAKIQKTGNIFSALKTAAPAKKSATTDKKIITVDDKEVGENIQASLNVRKTIAEAEALKGICEGIVKERGKAEFAKEYKKTGKNPDSFFLEASLDEKTLKPEAAVAAKKAEAELEKIMSEDKNFTVATKKVSMMVLPTDKYIKIDEDRANYLREKYKDEEIDMVTETTEFALDAVMLQKYIDPATRNMITAEEFEALDGKDKKKIYKNISDIVSDALSKVLTPEELGQFIKPSTAYSIKKGTIDEIGKLKKISIEEAVIDINPVFQLKGSNK